MTRNYRSECKITQASALPRFWWKGVEFLWKCNMNFKDPCTCVFVNTAKIWINYIAIQFHFGEAFMMNHLKIQTFKVTPSSFWLTWRKPHGVPMATSRATSPRISWVLPDFRICSFPIKPSDKSDRLQTDNLSDCSFWKVIFDTIIIHICLH